MTDKQSTNLLGTILIVVLICAIVYMAACGIYSMYITYETNQAINEEISNIDPSSQYGCPGCPDNFTDFANDMCSRNPDLIVGDGQNTVKCNSGW